MDRLKSQSQVSEVVGFRRAKDLFRYFENFLKNG